MLPLSRKTVGGWNTSLKTRRPPPTTYSHTFTYPAGATGYPYLWYVHGKKCGTGAGQSPTAYGVVAIIPP